jgi:hypothetical protein
VTLTEVDLNTALDIMEGILAAIFVHEELVNDLAARLPPRPARRKPPTLLATA